MRRSQNTLPIWKLYRHANCLDILIILLAACLATLAGVCLPLIVFEHGSAFTQFTNYAIAIQLEDNNRSVADYFCNGSLQTGLHEYLNSNDPADRLRSEIPIYSYYIFGISLLYFLYASLSRFLWCASAARQGRRMKLAYLKSVLTRHIGWFDMNSSAELHTHLSNGIQIIETGIGSSMSTIVEQFATFLASFVIAFVINWELSLVTCTILPVMFITIYIAEKIMVKAVIKQQNALAMAGSVAEEVLSSIKTVKVFSGQNKETERYNFHLKQVKRESYKLLFVTAVFMCIMMLLSPQFYSIGYWYGAMLFVECAITTGEIILVIIQIAIGTYTFYELLPSLGHLFAAIGSASVIYDIIDTESEIDSSSNGGIIPDTVEGNILFSDTVFSYPSRPDVEILHGLELSVKPRQTIALVGPSGCGKSTIVKLISRIYECIRGNISLDGIDIRDLNISWLRNQIGVVSQEPVLFNVSVAENISYGKESASMHDIVMAAKVANAHDFISSLPDGYNSVVGEGGAQLSGGQKQRIAIARVLVRDPKILLLDEATSALDTESEKYVQKALEKAKEGRTTIIIAHRLSTIQRADVIIGIDKGLVIEMGNHDELMKKEGLYYQLVMNQIMEEKKEIDKATIKKQKTFSSGPLGQLVWSNDTDYNDEFLGDTELSDLTEELTDESPLLKTEDSVTHPRSVRKLQSLAVLKEVLMLCFHKLHWFFLIVGVVLFIAFGAITSVNFIFNLKIQEYLSETDPDTLIRDANVYTVVLVATGIYLAALVFASVLSFGICEQQIREKVRQYSFRALLDKDISWFDQPENSVSILTHKLAVEAENISQISSLRMGLTLKTIGTSVAVVILSFALAWPIALVITPGLLMMFLGGYIQTTFTKRYAEHRNKLIEDSAKVTVESIENVFTVATLGIEKRLVNKYNQLLEHPFRYSLKSAAINGVIYGFSVSIVPFTVGFGYILGAYLYTSDKNSVYYADYAEIFTVVMAVLYTVVIGKDRLPDSQNAVLSAKGFVTIISRQQSMDAFNHNGIIPREVKGGLKMQDIQFIYPARPGVTVLQSFNISVSPGKTLALVGPSGSGKSTVISLIERFYDPTAGSILFDGTDICELNISWYRHQIGLVSQEPVLFNISIGDNIRYGANFRDVSDEEIIQAAKSANIHEFIQSLPQGYKTKVGMKGTQLSGGQKQRLAIARALIRDPKILLLDEATSALDTESEKIVQEALDKARESRTTIMIAHRLSTIYNSNNIAVLYNGRVIEQGTHSELMGQHGAYYFMNNVQ